MAESIVRVDRDLTVLAAKKAAADIDVLISQLLAGEATLDHGYAKLGHMLIEMQDNKYWTHLGHESFGEYINALHTKFNKGRTQLYHYASTVRGLQSFVTQEQLTEMGIAKASELAKSAKRNGGLPPAQEIIDQATNSDVTAATLRKMLFEADNTGESPKGTWLDQEGFYVESDERLVIQSADEAALRTDPMVPNDAPDWVRRKEARLRQAMEYLSTHSDKGIQ